MHQKESEDDDAPVATREEGTVTRVLVVDDDADVRDLVALKLRRNGFDVDTAGDGDTGLQRARDGRPDLVLLDIMMPKRSGIEVCQALREDAATATMPVILITARAQEADVERGFAAGADDYIVKPFSPRELLSRVQAVLARVSP